MASLMKPSVLVWLKGFLHYNCTGKCSVVTIRAPIMVQSKRQSVSQRASCKEWHRKDLMGLGHPQGRRQSHHLFSCPSQPAELEAMLHPECRQSYSEGNSERLSWDPAPNHLLKTSTGTPQSCSWSPKKEVGLSRWDLTKPPWSNQTLCNWSLWALNHCSLLLATNQAVGQGVPLWVQHHCSVTLVHAPVPSAESPALAKP